jgi:hypothetical protein
LQSVESDKKINLPPVITHPKLKLSHPCTPVAAAVTVFEGSQNNTILMNIFPQVTGNIINALPYNMFLIAPPGANNLTKPQ